MCYNYSLQNKNKNMHKTVNWYIVYYTVTNKLDKHEITVKY